MPAANMPDDLASIVNDLERRIRILELTARVGLNRIRFAWLTSAADTAVFNAWDNGPAGAAWADDATPANTGTGYPQVTLITGTKVLVMAQGNVTQLANDPTFRSFQADLGISVDGATPNNNPDWYRYQTHGPTTEGTNPLTVISGINTLTPGQHTFRFQSFFVDNVPAAANKPRMNNCTLIIIPIDG